ncbi:hypothetical protein Osc2_23680 [Ruminococcus sp. 25CYCFAH16]
MGIKKITGVVLARRAGFLKVLLDSRKDDGYDILEASMAARKLNVGDRFSLYATSSMVKLVKGKKVYTYKDATEQPDGYEIYELILNAKQLKIINKLLSNEYSFLNYKRENPDIFYSYDEKDEESRKLIKDIAQKIFFMLN